MATKYRNHQTLEYFLKMLDKSTSEKFISISDEYRIIHTSKQEQNIVYKTLLDIANQNNDQESANLIMEYEKIVHLEDLEDLLECTRLCLKKEELQLWNIRKINKEKESNTGILDWIKENQKKIKMWISIIVNSFLLSILPWAMDQE